MKKKEMPQTEAHMMETFPEPQGMPVEWQEHDVAAAKYRLMKQAEMAKKNTAAEVEFSADAEKAAHLMEKFPSLKIEPQDWHCNTNACQ